MKISVTIERVLHPHNRKHTHEKETIFILLSIFFSVVSRRVINLFSFHLRTRVDGIYRDQNTMSRQHDH